MSLTANNKTYIMIMPPGADPLQNLKEDKESVPRDIFIRFFTCEEHAKSFLYEGVSKWNTFSELRKLEIDRADSTDGFVEDFYIDRPKIGNVGDKYLNTALFSIKITDDIMPFDMEPNSKDYIVYCLTYNQNDKKLTLKNYLNTELSTLSFSTQDQFAVIIINISKFLNTIRNVIKKDFNTLTSHGLVNYQMMSPFSFLNYSNVDHIISKLIYTKNIELSKENEFRFCFHKKDNNESFLLIKLGDLSDIAVLAKRRSDGGFELI